MELLTCFCDKQYITSRGSPLHHLLLIFHILGNFCTPELCRNGKKRLGSWFFQALNDIVHMFLPDPDRLSATPDLARRHPSLHFADDIVAVAYDDAEAIDDYCCVRHCNMDEDD